MQFLKTLFWVIAAALVAIFFRANWTDVTFKLWGDTIVDVKLPVLVAISFLLGFLPTWSIFRARLWAVKRRLEPYERQSATAAQPVAETSIDNDPSI
mgnify:FL=1